MWLNERETALILAGLRHLQDQLINNGLCGLSAGALAILDNAAVAEDAITDIDGVYQKVNDLG